VIGHLIRLGMCVTVASYSAAAARAGSRLSLDGYFKNFSTVEFLPSYQRQLLGVGDTPKGLVSNRLRLNTRYTAGSGITVHLSYNLLPRVQDQVFFTLENSLGRAAHRMYRAKDLDPRLYPDAGEPATSFAVYQNLDRAHVRYQAADFDLIVGRQPVAWGAARVINPIDMVAPFLYTELDTEDRIGVDAIRLRKPLGALSELDMGFIAGPDLSAAENAYYLRGRFYAGRSDVTLIGAAFREHLMVGFDVARGMGGAGCWLEAAYTWMETFSGAPGGTGPNYLRLSTGVDYSFPGDLYGYLEYHFNGAGRNEASDYLAARMTTPYRDAAVYLLGKHYLAPGFTYPLSPLWLGSLSLLLNASDGSVLVSPAIEYNIAEDIYLEAGAFMGLGADTTPGPELVELASEFGTYENTFYMSFRTYF
jgi:hypothetical protein